MTLTVLIVAHNEAARLPRCLAALRAQLASDVEVVVADDGSTDGTAAAAAQALGPVRVLRLPHRGVGATRRSAIEAARGDRLAFLDADCVPQAGWIEAVRRGDDGIVVGRVLAEPTFSARLLALAQFGEFVGDQDAQLQNFALLNAAGPADLFRRFSMPEVAAGEDRLLSWRMAQAGVRIRFDPRQVVLHAPPPSALLARQASYARRFVRLRRIEPSLPGGWLLRWSLVGAPAAAAARLVRDLGRLPAARRGLAIPVVALPMYVAALVALRLFDALAMAREMLRFER